MSEQKIPSASPGQTLAQSIAARQQAPAADPVVTVRQPEPPARQAEAPPIASDPGLASAPEVTLAQAISQGIAAAIVSTRQQGPLEMVGFSPEHIARIREPPEPQMYRDISWRSEETGATAVAHVVASKKFPNGRVVYLAGYTHPREAYVSESNGGKVPDGLHIWAGAHATDLPATGEPAAGAFNAIFLQWRWVTFYQADLRRFVGKEIRAHHCQEPDGLSAPWIEGRVGAVNESE